MKRTIYIITLIICSELIIAQSTKQNYILSKTYQNADVSNFFDADGSSSMDVIRYYDGLGRPIQSIQKAITPSGADLINLTEYDKCGREYRHWLPVTSMTNGAYVAPKTITDNTTTLYGGATNPYTETIIESSALNRTVGERSPGEWNSHPTKTTYGTNADSEVAYFFVNSGNQLERSNYYAANTLYKTINTDQDGKRSIEYKDKFGRVVMKQDGSNGDINTYYVYNDLGQLCYVLPPLAVDAMSASTAYPDNNVNLLKYGYLYQYDDSRGNCIYKRLPGCEPIYMAYDLDNRLIITQDGNQRVKGNCTQTMYDNLGRVLYTLEVKPSITFGELQMYFSSNLLVDQFSPVQVENAVLNTGYSIFQIQKLDLTPRRSFTFTLVQILTINYYNDYRFINLLSDADKTTLTYNNNQEQNGYTAQWTNAKGLLTGTRIYHLDDPTKYETTALYYDDRGQIVQTRSSNHLGGYDITYNKLDFRGKVLNTRKEHNISGQAVIPEVYRYAYDKAERLLTTRYKLGANDTITLASNTYDELGRVATKTLGGIDATTYAYNIRSWTTGITGSRFTENLYYNANTASLPTFTPCYNGNIAGMQWNVANESGNRAYSFTYDGLNRLTDAIYTGFSGGVISGTQNRYDEHFGFDKMGNITTFTRNGLLSSSGGYGTVDNLSFTYNGNQKVKITDAGSNGIFYGDEEFVQNGTNTGNSCAYDANGNRLYDSNSNIWGIQYNTLNLPDVMQFYQGHQTNYTYSAAGAKLKVIDKTAPAGVELPVTSLNTILTNPSVSMTTTTDYVDNKIYENGTLKRILTPEGYWQDGTYYYFLKDHLGSNRVVINSSGGIAETSSYYPSGMRFGESAVNGGSVQPYRHTGMEMQSMHGLNWIDNGARFRTVDDGGGLPTRDPLCEMKPWQSPYMYCSGNPVNRTDPTGLYDLPEVTVTAPAPKNNNNNNFNFVFQQLLDDANRNTPQIPRITPPTPTFNLPTNPNANNVVINNKDSKKGNGTLQNISDALAAIGISESAVEIAVTESGGKQIVYVTLKGTTAIANAAKVSSVLKNIGGYTFYLGAIVDVARAATGEQSWLKAGASTGVAYTAMKVGGWPGFLIGGGYILLDKLGAFDGPPENIPYYQQPTCPIDATKIVIPNYIH